MSTDWSKSSVEIVKDLIVESNPDFAPVRNSFSLGGVVPFAGVGGINSSITLIPIAGSGYEGIVTLQYKRVNFYEYCTRVNPTNSIHWGDEPGQTKMTPTSPFTEIVLIINAAYGRDMTNEISGMGIEEVHPGTEYNLELQADQYPPSQLFTSGGGFLTVTQTA